MFQRFDAVAGHRLHSWHATMVLMSAGAHAAAIVALARLPAPPRMEWTAEEIVFLAVLSTRPTSHDHPSPPEPAARPARPAPAAPPASAAEPVTAAPEEAPNELPPLEARLALPPGLEAPVAPALAGSGDRDGNLLHVDSIALIPELDFPFPIEPGERFRLPRLRNRDLIVDILTRRYPRRLAYRGLSSAATLRLAIDERGIVDPGSVRIIAFDREEFAVVVMDVARRFRFTPARYRGQDVPVVIDIPVEWVAGP